MFATGSVAIYASPWPDEAPEPSRYDLSLPAPDPLPEYQPRTERKAKPHVKSKPKRQESPRPKPTARGWVDPGDLPRSSTPVPLPRPVTPKPTPTPSPTPTKTVKATPIPTSTPAPKPSPSAPVTSGVNAELRAQVISLMNQQRALNGLPPLASSPALSDSAQKWSAQMSAEGRMYHSGHAPENVAWGYSTAELVMAAWMQSPGHRANILDPRSTSAGVGLVGTYWTVQFQ